METNKIIQGDAKKVLKTLPAESIDMCITSPPYWALRDYGKETEEIWDGDEDCKHKFNLRHIKRKPSKQGAISNKAKYGQGYRDFKRGFCQKCGAWKGQLGLEPNFDLYIKHICDVFDGVKRVLKKTGTCWVNLGDSYYTKSGSSFLNDNLNSNEHIKKLGINKANEVRGRGLLKEKNLTLIPLRFAIEMQKRGWILRNVIIWHKPNCMPSSIKDRFTVDFEYLFFLSKNKKYYFKQQREPHKKESIERTKHKWDGHREPGSSFEGMNITKMCHPKGRNKRCVWRINTKSFKGAHFAVYPEELIETPIKAGCPKGGVVLDPFLGSGTTCLTALKQNKSFLGIELNPDYIKIAKRRIIDFLKNG